MDNFITKESIDQLYKELSVTADKLYNFVMLYNEYINTAHDYGFDNPISMVEVHTLTMIEDNPGITISALAALWHRTNSAISQNVTKLEKKGLVTRQRSELNGKHILLYLTPKGVELSTAHKKYDCKDILETREALLEHCTQSELDTFYKVIEHYVNLF